MIGFQSNPHDFIGRNHMNLNNLYKPFLGGWWLFGSHLIGTIAKNLCKINLKKHVCTYYGIEECMSSNDLGNML